MADIALGKMGGAPILKSTPTTPETIVDNRELGAEEINVAIKIGIDVFVRRKVGGKHTRLRHR